MTDDKLEISMQLECIGTYGDFNIMYKHIKKADTDKDNRHVCIWFSDNSEPDLIIDAGEYGARDSLDEMFECIRKASMKIVQPTLKRIK